MGSRITLMVKFVVKIQILVLNLPSRLLTHKEYEICKLVTSTLLQITKLNDLRTRTTAGHSATQQKYLKGFSITKMGHQKKSKRCIAVAKATRNNCINIFSAQ